MPFDPVGAANLSEAFRERTNDELEILDLRALEGLLQQVLGVTNLRNVQLWTRRGAVQRNFINRGLGEYELDLRTWIAEKIVNQIEPNFPVKRRVLSPPFDSDAANIFRRYANDNWVREYATRIFFENGNIVIEYSADSSNNPDEIDFSSDEFSDILEE